jgi:hypothetical protein
MVLAPAFTARCRVPTSFSRAMAGLASTAAATSAADINFSLVVQLLHLITKGHLRLALSFKW